MEDGEDYDTYDSVSQTGHHRAPNIPQQHLASPDVRSSRHLEITGNDNFVDIGTASLAGSGSDIRKKNFSHNAVLNNTQFLKFLIAYTPYYTPSLTSWRDDGMVEGSNRRTLTQLTPVQQPSASFVRHYASNGSNQAPVKRPESASIILDRESQVSGSDFSRDQSSRNGSATRQVIRSSYQAAHQGRQQANEMRSSNPQPNKILPRVAKRLPPKTISGTLDGVRSLNSATSVNGQKGNGSSTTGQINQSQNELMDVVAGNSFVESPAQTTRKRSEPIDEFEYRQKMLKMVTTLVTIAEEQRNPKMVKERIVNENAHYFQQLLIRNVKLPLKIPSAIEELNNALVNIELSVALVSTYTVLFIVNKIFH